MKMTLSSSADARLSLSIVGSGKLLVRSTWSGFFAACRVCEVRRRRMMKVMMGSVVAADAESSREAINDCFA